MAGDHVQLVQELVSTTRRAIQDIDTESGDEFQDVVSVVRRNFSRVTRTTDDEGRHRGRRKRIQWKTKIFLLKRSNPDFFPSPAECRFLTRHGFGEATDGDSNLIRLCRTWSLGRLETHIMSLFPKVPLSLVGFQYARCDKGRRVTTIIPQSLQDLERKMGKAKIIIVPNRDIPLNETDQETPVFPGMEPQASTSTETEPQASTSTEVVPQASIRTEIVPQAPSSPESVHQEPSSIQPVLDTQENGWTMAGTPTVQFRSIAESENDSAVSVEVAAHLDHALSTLESLLDLEGERQMTVSRANVVEPLLQQYRDDPSILQSRLHVSFAGESGDDFGGLSKDMFTAFWTGVFESYFNGDRCKVPSLPFHRVRKELWKYESIGSILTHSVALTRCLPSMVARTSIIAIVFESDVDKQCLLEDFFLFCTRAEQHLLQKAMSDFQSLDDKEMDSLITFFSINGYMGMPNRREISDQISEIAQKELLDTPRPLYEAMRRGIPSSHLSSFWAQLTIDELSALITSQRPTPMKVVDCLLAEGEYIRPEEEKVLYFLKQFVRGLDQEDLMSFLHFVTGSIHMPVGGIKVSFTKLAGELRRPIVHTCSNLIEISVLYSSFQEFRREMTQYLRNELAFHFSVM